MNMKYFLSLILLLLLPIISSETITLVSVGVNGTICSDINSTIKVTPLDVNNKIVLNIDNFYINILPPLDNSTNLIFYGITKNVNGGYEVFFIQNKNSNKTISNITLIYQFSQRGKVVEGNKTLLVEECGGLSDKAYNFLDKSGEFILDNRYTIIALTFILVLIIVLIILIKIQTS